MVIEVLPALQVYRAWVVHRVLKAMAVEQDYRDRLVRKEIRAKAVLDSQDCLEIRDVMDSQVSVSFQISSFELQVVPLMLSCNHARQL